MRRRCVAMATRVRLTLAYRPPLAWSALLRFLAGRATAGVEWVDRSGLSVGRPPSGNHRGWLKVEPIAGRNALSVELATSLMPRLAGSPVSRQKPLRLECEAGRDRRAPLADDRRSRFAGRCPGLRVPGAFDGFELAVRAILGQRISVRAATTLAGRLADRFGEPIETPLPGLNRLSPTPARWRTSRSRT